MSFFNNLFLNLMDIIVQTLFASRSEAGQESLAIVLQTEFGVWS